MDSAAPGGLPEGWALYAERLAWESGWYEGDPYGTSVGFGSR